MSADIARKAGTFKTDGSNPNITYFGADPVISSVTIVDSVGKYVIADWWYRYRISKSSATGQ